MRQIKLKVSLDSNKSTGYGHLLHCCGKYQQVHIDSLQEDEYWECVECEKPLLIRTEKGHFLIGQNVTI